MSALDNLYAIGRGEVPGDDGLLGNARCGWGDGELLGEESVLAAFSAQPFTESEAFTVETVRGAALIGRDDALIADVYGQRIGRLWRVAAGIGLPHEPAIDVAFDPDMRQQRGDVFFRAEDHPELPADLHAPLLAAARTHVEETRRADNLRVRAFIVRAFGAGSSGAALLAVHAMGNQQSRSASFYYAILGIGNDEVGMVHEKAAPRPWTPRF